MSELNLQPLTIRYFSKCLVTQIKFSALFISPTPFQQLVNCLIENNNFMICSKCSTACLFAK